MIRFESNIIKVTEICLQNSIIRRKFKKIFINT